MLTILGGFSDRHAHDLMMQWDDPGSIMLQNVQHNDLILAFGKSVAKVLMTELLNVRRRTEDYERRRQAKTDEWPRERSMAME